MRSSKYPELLATCCYLNWSHRDVPLVEEPVIGNVKQCFGLLSALGIHADRAVCQALLRWVAATKFLIRFYRENKPLRPDEPEVIHTPIEIIAKCEWV